MDRKNSLFILFSVLFTLALCLAVLFGLRPASERLPILLGWGLASLNFTTALVLGLISMQKSFESFKLTLMVGTALRMGAMLVFLFCIVQFKKEWTMPFSFSLLSCFGIYIMLEVGLFYTKAKRMMS